MLVVLISLRPDRACFRLLGASSALSALLLNAQWLDT